MSGDGERCRACDGPVTVTDRFCAHCGHDLTAGLIPLHTDEDVVMAEATTVSRGGGRRVTVAVAGALVAVVAVVVGVVVATGGDSGSPTASPADDAPGATPDPANPAAAFDPRGDLSEVAGEDASPAAAPSRRTEIRPGPTPEPPMLGEVSGAVVLVRTDQVLLVVDLDSGEQTEIESVAPDPESVEGSTMAVVGDEFWVLEASGLRAFTVDTLVEVDPARPGFAADGVVGLLGGQAAGESVVVLSAEGPHTLISADSPPVPVVVPAGFEIIGAHDTAVVLTRPEIGGVWLLGGGRVTTGRPLAVANGLVVVLDCTDDLTCFFEVLDLTTGEVVRAVQAEAEPSLPDALTASVLAPDGSLYLVAGGGSTTEQVLDLRTGERIPGLVVGVVTAAAFSADAEWLFLGGDAADRALLTAVAPDFRVPQRAVATNVDLGASLEVLVLQRPPMS